LRNEGIPAERIAVGGDSAGAGLAMALIGRLRDGHEKLPVCAWLVSPWTDLTMSGSTFASKDAVDQSSIKNICMNWSMHIFLRDGQKGSARFSSLRRFHRLSAITDPGVSAETLLDDATRLANVAVPRMFQSLWKFGHT